MLLDKEHRPPNPVVMRDRRSGGLGLRRIRRSAMVDDHDVKALLCVVAAEMALDDPRREVDRTAHSRHTELFGAL